MSQVNSNPKSQQIHISYLFSVFIFLYLFLPFLKMLHKQNNTDKDIVNRTKSLLSSSVFLFYKNPNSIAHCQTIIFIFFFTCEAYTHAQNNVISAKTTFSTAHRRRRLHYLLCLHTNLLFFSFCILFSGYGEKTRRKLCDDDVM